MKESVGIFYSLSGDISQPTYRGDLKRSIEVCAAYQNENIKYLQGRYDVDCYLVINYNEKLIDDLSLYIENIYFRHGVTFKNIKILNIKTLGDILKQEINDNQVIENFNEIFNNKVSAWIQPYQFFTEAFANLNYNYYIKARLDCFTIRPYTYFDLIEILKICKSWDGMSKYTNGTASVPLMYINGVNSFFPVDLMDFDYAVDKNTVEKCSSNFNKWFYFSENLHHTKYDYYPVKFIKSEEFLANIFVQNGIFVSQSPTSRDQFLYRKDFDFLSMETLNNWPNLEEYMKLVVTK